MRIISDIFAYTAAKMPSFNSISISGYHMQEAGATADLELAYTLADGVEYLRAGLGAGLTIDQFAPRLSFFWAIGMNFFMEVAKMRAARALWAGWCASSSRRTPSRCPCARIARRSGWSLTAQDVFNNVARTCIEAMAATQGHTQSLHTNALDEAIALPTDFSARIARNTQLLLQQEIGHHRASSTRGAARTTSRGSPTTSPSGPGSTSARSRQAGGMAKAIEAGHPEDAHRGGRGPHPGPDRLRAPRSVIGVNTYRARPTRTRWTCCTVDNDEVVPRRSTSSSGCGPSGTSDEVPAALEALTARGRGRPGPRVDRRRRPVGNLLALAVDAARAKATVGEISDALEKVYGRHQRRDPYDLRGVPVRGRRVRHRRRRQSVERCSPPPRRSRRPRAAGRGSWSPRWARTGTTAGQKVVVTAFADLGFDVDVGPLFSTPG